MPSLPHSLALQEIIRQQIASSPEQRITFAQYMELVLYHPVYGYYGSGQVAIGAGGDFFTSSSLGADFGELWAEQFIEIAEILEFPQPFYLVEVGAGSGQLAHDILHYLQRKAPRLYNSLVYIIIETSQSLRSKQQSFLASYQAQVSWKTWEDLENISLVGCIFSNELIDAFPVHQLVWHQGNLQEVYLTHKDNQLQEVIADISTARIRDYFNLVSIDISAANYPDGYRTEVNLAALDWLQTVAGKLKQGYLITVDYGYSAEKYYHPQRAGGTLQCYWQHQRHNDPYRYLGYQDITTHVDFTALERQGEVLGLEKLGLSKQGMVLMALGLGDRLADLSSGKYNLQEVLHRRDALHQLMDPAGLGNFFVLFQSKGLTEKQKQHTLKALIDF